MPPGPATAPRRHPRPKASAGRGNVLVEPGGVVGPCGDGYVRRDGLVRRLVQARQAAVAVIVAPPGYGKSSLLSEWSERDERPFLWVRFERAK